MSRKFSSLTYFALLACMMSLFVSACRNEILSHEPGSSETEVPIGSAVWQTDSSEWRVYIFKEHLLYREAVETNLPAPWVLPTREDAAVLRSLSFGNNVERFVTSDGYTFGMPSVSVTPAGQKTRYSVLGLWKRKTVIDVPF